MRLVKCGYCDEKTSEGRGIWVPVLKDGRDYFYCYDCCRSIIREVLHGESEQVTREEEPEEERAYRYR